jgi:hypothetical protein
MKNEINTDALQNLNERDVNPQNSGEETTTSSPSSGKYNLIKKRGEVKTVDPRTLTFHPAPRELYEERSPEEEQPFYDSVAANGLLQRPFINSKGEVIVGQRGVHAAVVVGLPFIEVEVIVFDEEDAHMVAIESNRQRIKSNIELYREAKKIQVYKGKKGGTRTDLDPTLSDKDRLQTDDRIALELGISATRASQLLKVGDTKPELLKQVDRLGGPSLDDAYKSLLPEKPKHDHPVEEIDLNEIKPCPVCGQATRRIVKTPDGKLAYADETTNS